MSLWQFLSFNCYTAIVVPPFPFPVDTIQIQTMQHLQYAAAACNKKRPQTCRMTTVMFMYVYGIYMYMYVYVIKCTRLAPGWRLYQFLCVLSVFSFVAHQKVSSGRMINAFPALNSPCQEFRTQNSTQWSRSFAGGLGIFNFLLNQNAYNKYEREQWVEYVRRAQFTLSSSRLNLSWTIIR